MKRFLLVLLSGVLLFSMLLPGVAAANWKKSKDKKHDRPTIWSEDSDGVTYDKNGRPRDKKTGRYISKDEAAEREQRKKLYGGPADTYQLWSKGGEKPFGITAPPWFSWVPAKDGRLGGDDLYVDFHRWVFTAKGDAGAGPDGGGGSGTLGVSWTQFGIGGQTGTHREGGDRTYATVKASGSAAVLMEGSGKLGLYGTKDGVYGNAGYDLFAGGKAGGKIDGTVGLCGAEAKLTGTGEVSAGVGRETKGYFAFDWTTGKLKVGGKQAITAGVGGGVGGEAEIDLKNIWNNRGAIMDCVRGLPQQTSWQLENAWVQVQNAVIGLWNAYVVNVLPADPLTNQPLLPRIPLVGIRSPGNNTPRDTNTVPGQTYGPGGEPTAGVGITR